MLSSTRHPAMREAQPVAGDELLVQRQHAPPERHDADRAAEHAGGEQPRLGHADHRDVEELAGAAQAGVIGHADHDRVAARRVARDERDRGVLAERMLGCASR